MKFYSTKRLSPEVDLQTAVLQGLPVDNGLFMPEKIYRLSDYFWDNIEKLSFTEIAFEVANCLVKGMIEEKALREIVESAVNFDAPLVSLTDNLHCLELFHGPSSAFKDFGARFMARLISHFVQQEANAEKVYILVATSGDTGGAVAQGFLDTEGIEVIILYPSQKISEIQEKQLTTLGSNITALEITGTFDDCQRLVKAAFLDQDVQKQLQISSANSINIARLIPQAFYYVYAYAQLKKKNEPVVFCVPSGNFGNLTAGLLAKKMGLPVHQFIAANNANDVFKQYLHSNTFKARPSVPTLSNAMDVGNPSNLQRIQDLYEKDIDKVRKDIVAYSFSDEETLAAIKEIAEKYNYVACPHTAVAYLGMKQYLEKQDVQGIFLSTAHPAKFLDIVEPVLTQTINIPANIQTLMNREKQSIVMGTDFQEFKDYLLNL